MNEHITHTLLGKLSKPDKLRRRDCQQKLSSWSGWSSTPSFPRPIKSCSPVLQPVLLDDVCAKQEHLIAMTKIKPSDQTQAFWKKLKYLLEPAAIFIEVWDLALRSRLACAQWVWDWGLPTDTSRSKRN